MGRKKEGKREPRPGAPRDPRLSERPGRPRLPRSRPGPRLQVVRVPLPDPRRHPRDADRRGREAIGRPKAQVIDLDDAAAMRAADPSGMLGSVSGLADHCREGYRLGRAAEGLPSADDLTALAFCGMGGSAVPGDLVRALYAARLRLPVTVIRTPELPAWCGPHSLVVVSSYSGNTAETLTLFAEAVARGCRVIVVTSGGQLAQRASELAVGTVTVPARFMPRAAVGYLALGVLGALGSVGLIPSVAADLDETLGELGRILEVNGPAVPSTNNPAKTLALRIGERFPVVWGAEGLAAVAAYRWKTQFNENAKVPAFWGALPEVDHNEVVGWAEGAGRSFFLVALRH